MLQIYHDFRYLSRYKKKVKATEKQIHWGVDTTFLQLEFSLWENEKNRAKKVKWLGLQNEVKPF